MPLRQAEMTHCLSELHGPLPGLCLVKLAAQFHLPSTGESFIQGIESIELQKKGFTQAIMHAWHSSHRFHG